MKKYFIDNYYLSGGVGYSILDENLKVLEITSGRFYPSKELTELIPIKKVTDIIRATKDLIKFNDDFMEVKESYSLKAVNAFKPNRL